MPQILSETALSTLEASNLPEDGATARLLATVRHYQALAAGSIAPGHLDPDPPGGVVVTADREDGGPVVVERIGR